MLSTDNKPINSFDYFQVTQRVAAQFSVFHFSKREFNSLNHFIVSNFYSSLFLHKDLKKNVLHISRE